MTDLRNSRPPKRARFPLHQYLWNKLRRPSIVQFGQARIYSVHPCLSWRMTRSIRSGRYEFQERNLLAKLLRPTDRVLEIGAGVGLISILCAKTVGCENVLCYEANPDLEPLIRQNFKLNSLEIAHVCRAVSTADESISMYVTHDHWSSSVYDRSAKCAGAWRTVQADSINRIVANFAPSLLILDVEGYEVDLLGTANLDGVRGILVDMHPHLAGAERIDSLRARLGSLGFSLTDALDGVEVYVRANSGNSA